MDSLLPGKNSLESRKVGALLRSIESESNEPNAHPFASTLQQHGNTEVRSLPNEKSENDSTFLSLAKVESKLKSSQSFSSSRNLFLKTMSMNSLDGAGDNRLKSTMSKLNSSLESEHSSDQGIIPKTSLTDVSGAEVPILRALSSPKKSPKMHDIFVNIKRSNTQVISDDIRIPEPVTEVRPYLLLGSDIIPSRDDAVGLLQSIGVTHILNMASELPNVTLQTGSNFVYKHIPIEDHVDQDLDRPLNEAVDFIVNGLAKSSESKIFVHCKAGVSRSVTVILAYLVLVEDMALMNAYRYLKTIRPSIGPNFGFLLHLTRLELDKHGKTVSIADISSIN